ncbi:MAG: hypothetical protein SGI74_07380 [Oligoflexia bacterium]|nr:hypothetical protein [Oligoflexia bacterium]
MKKSTYILGCILMVIDVVINVIIMVYESTILGMFSLIAGILVFSCGMIWLIHRDDEELHIKNLFLIFPMGLLCFAFVKMLEQGGLTFQSNPESLQEVGSIFMAQYQAGLWLSAAISLMVFVMAGALMVRRRG